MACITLRVRQVRLRNTNPQGMKVTIADNSYNTGTVSKTIGPNHETLFTLYLEKSYGWYDFTVKVEGSETEARFAGRVETGKSSFSNPLMGGMV
jgi:phospholipase C